MKLDPGIHIVMHSVLFLKPDVTSRKRITLKDHTILQAAGEVGDKGGRCAPVVAADDLLAKRTRLFFTAAAPSGTRIFGSAGPSMIAAWDGGAGSRRGRDAVAAGGGESPLPASLSLASGSTRRSVAAASLRDGGGSVDQAAKKG